jgi:serine/threonine-protein kinase RsbW
MMQLIISAVRLQRPMARTSVGELEADTVALYHAETSLSNSFTLVVSRNAAGPKDPAPPLKVSVDISTLEGSNYRILGFARLGVPVDGSSGADAIHLKSLLMAGDRLSYRLDSTLETVDNAEQTASRIASETGFGEDEVMQIAMAVREAAVNAVLHGNAYDPEKKVELEFERTGQDLVITIRDQGKGFDQKKIADPLAAENLLKTSGRGIFLIRSFMDDVQINPSQAGTEIKLVKHVHGTAGGGKEASQ